ncbi:MAG: DUF4476 domain-containing protein [Crocinitomix sp.]|nr:DUF4476 domain-containing protein [Crocinitomix sp.]
MKRKGNIFSLPLLTRWGFVVGGLVFITSCEFIEDVLIVDPPNVPEIRICDHVATNDDVTTMKDKIKSQAFKDERMDRTKMVTKGYCFTAAQVVDLMSAMGFEDEKLTIAKDLYDQTTDQQNYDVVIDALAFKSDRDELKAFIGQ